MANDPYDSAKSSAAERPYDFVAVGLSALGTICVIREPYGPENDYKADALLFWEPEFATFATLSCSVLARWGRNVALLTSIASDSNGLLLRRMLEERKVRLLFARCSQRTARQLSISPLRSSIRYNLDLQVQRKDLTVAEKRDLRTIARDITSAKSVAFDKYELDVMNEIFSSESWTTARRHPLVLFETGSRPSSDILAGSRTNSTVLPEFAHLEHIDVFTTTWEWILAVASRFGKQRSLDKYLAHPPGSWQTGDGSERVFRSLVSTVFPTIMPRKSKKPRLIIVTLGPQGCYVVYRHPRNLSRYSVLHRPVKRRALTTLSCLGAGDMFRAVLIESFLSDTPLIQRDDASVAFWQRSKVMEAVDLAQYGVCRWLERNAHNSNYFGEFPDSFLRLRSDWEEGRAVRTMGSAHNLVHRSGLEGTVAL